MKENTFFGNISQIWANMSFSRWFAKTANVREIKNGSAKGLAIIAVFSLVISSFNIPVVQAVQSEVTVCHVTGNGYNLLTFNANALSAHLGHGDIYPVPDNGCPTQLPTTSPDVTVTIVKFIDGKTVEPSVTDSFPMTATWNATNIGSGSGSYILSPVGFNNPNPYYATTSNMTSGASYSTAESTDGSIVGADCDEDKPYELAGYTYGDTLDAAKNALISPQSPSFTGITTNKFVIVWNTTCGITPPPVPATITIQKVWTDSNGTPIDAPDNKGDITISAQSSNDIATCNYANNNLDCSMDGFTGEDITVSETGVPAGWEVDQSTVGSVTPSCNENNECSHTVINKLKTPAPCGTELISNGGFESPVISGGWDIRDSGTAGLGWSVGWVRPAGAPSTAKAELHRGVNGWNSHNGSQHTELDSDWDGPSGSNSGEDGSVKLFQDIPTNLGNVYDISLWTSPRPGLGSSENVTRVKAGSTILDTIVEDGASNGNTVWTKHTYTFVATSSLTRIEISDQGTGNSLGAFLDDVSVKEECSSDVSICKYDNHQNPLPGWDVFLKGNKIDTVTVNPDGTDYPSVNLPAGDYLFIANGTYVYRPGDPNASTSDAAYSKRAPSDSVYGGAFAPWVRELDFPTPYTGWLGVQVDDANFNWGMTFNPLHKYSALKNMVSSGTVNFRILDDNYSDNSGSLSVDIYPIVKGTTGKNGCVTLNNVDFGTYTLDEIMKDGWSNVSGKGDSVVVNGSTESYSLTNKCDTGCTSTVTICKKDSNNTFLPGWNVMVKGPKLETVAVNSNAIGGATSTNTLTNGQQYLVVASGTWQNRGFETVDSRFTTPDGWVTPLDAPIGGYPNELLELQVNQGFVPWGSYNTAHTYNYLLTGNGSTANFRVFDGDVNTNTPDPNWYGDNQGSLSVDIYPVYSGTTNKDGCVTLENVPFGDYTLDEIMKDGWSNVSGKGDSVVVDEPQESFSLINLCSPNGCEDNPCVAQNPSIASGAFTQFEGLATTLPTDLSDEIYYPYGADGPAVAAGPTGYPGAWDGPLSDPDITEGGATWVSNSATQPTNPAGAGGDGSIDTWRLYSHSFTIPAGATSLTPAYLHFAADNEVVAFLDGVQVGFNNSFSTATDAGPFVLTPGTHRLKFAVKNWAFDQENNPTGLIYNFDFHYCGSETQQGDPDFHVRGTKWNDADGNSERTEGENGIEGWNIYLTHKISTLSIPSDNGDGVDSPILETGKNYLVKVTGTFDAGDNILADAKYSERNSNPNWTDLVQNYESYGPTLLDLQVDGSTPNWGPYNTGHTYWTQLSGANSVANFKINDVYYPNNVGGLTVEIYEVDQSTVTDSNGDYDFDVTGMDGEYFVIEGSQNGWKQITPEGGIYTVNGNENSYENDFGNQQVCISQYDKVKKGFLFDLFSFISDEELPSCANGISGTKYKDGTENTVTLSGWVIYLDLDNDGQLDDGEPYDVTDEDGNYSFSNLPTGTYHIREVGQEGWTQVVPGDNGSLDATVLDSVVTGKDFTNKQGSNGGGGDGFGISGNVYNDNNAHNGTKDSGEAGLAGWVIYLDADGSNTLNNEEISTTSGANGDYAFTGLPAGCYTVREVLQASWNETEPAATEYQVAIGGASCLLTLNASTSDVAMASSSHWTDMFFKTAQAAVNSLNATGLNFGNIFLGGGGGSGGGSGGGGSGGGSGGGNTPTPPVVGKVLGDSTNTPSDPTPQVLGVTTELPRTGSPIRNILALFLSLAVILTPTLISGKKKLKTQRI